MLVSEYLELGDELNELGVFDALIDKDSHFFINIVRLKYSTVPEFKSAYDLVNKRFTEIATLLDAAQMPSTDDKMYRAARNLFDFSEVNGINLGFAESVHGSGFGDVLTMQVLGDAYQIIKAGSKQPEIFHLVSLFEENIGPDRLSDMIASIIEPSIIKFTLRILDEIGISAETRNSLVFYDNGLLKNPFKNCPLLLLPTDVLHKLPIASYWGDIDYVIEENRSIRREINAEISDVWEKWHSAQRKSYIRERIFMNPDACARVIDGYRNEEAPVFDPSADPEYYSEFLFGEVRKDVDFSASDKTINSFDGAMEIIAIFKDWIENNRGWSLLKEANSAKREKIAQLCIHLCAKYYVKQNDLDISFEPDAGRGPVDVKLSRGGDKTIIETKLSTSSQYLHGYKTQVEEYAKSEGTKKRIYVLIDLGNPRRIATIKKEHRRNQKSCDACPELVIIDAREKKPASIYKPADSWDTVSLSGFDIPEFDMADYPEMNFTSSDFDGQNFDM